MDSMIARKLTILATRLIDQEKAHVLVPPQQAAAGFWFGGGNMVRLEDGSLVICGRYRNYGDSRTGLAAGERGLELALFRAAAFSGPWEKFISFKKADVQVDTTEVLSIEGSSLYVSERGVELFLSSEKQLQYPPGLDQYRKPGTGVWSIDVIHASSLSGLESADIVPVLSSEDPPFLHVKDPVVFTSPSGNTALLYCSHPFAWSSSNTGLASRESGENCFCKVADSVMSRGFVWDVAATRITDRMPVPKLGVLAKLPDISLYFYDGAECVRQHDQNANAVQRPRGYSCEEIGGLAGGYDEAFPEIDHISVEAPLFISPWGTGCSRYVSTLVTADGIHAIWQQSRPDGSQPLVGHFLPMAEVEKILKP